MNEIINLIRLTHNATLCDAIQDYWEGTPIDEATEEVISFLRYDDAFNEYSEDELQAAISEAITEY